MELTKKINNLIDKIPVTVGIIMLAASVSFASLYSSQETTMLVFMMSWGQSGMASETLGWWFYIMGGLINFGLFELLMRVIVYFIRWQLPMLDRNTTYHYARVIFSINYLILGLFHLAYFFFPLLQVWGALFDFLVSSLFLYLAYHLISRKTLPNFLWARALRATAMIFFIYHGVNIFLGLFMSFGGVL
ncbi:MAG: hypothetical protein GX756_02640 [Clostridiales bacterium]|nr:hypothetical protein [Clostridiales bacterium]